MECYEQSDLWFGGVTCTNGAGSAREGQFAETTDEEMRVIRAEEQREASRVGAYSFVAQLDYASSEIKAPSAGQLESELAELLERSRPTVAYTHNLADRHGSHIAVACALIKAIRKLPNEIRPEKVIGCEVWRDLDWLPNDKKVVMALDKYPELSAKLNGLFVSQIAGGKRYDLAVQGRRRANATFLDSHETDDYGSVIFGMDLTPLIKNESLGPKAYVGALVDAFGHEVNGQVERYF